MPLLLKVVGGGILGALALGPLLVFLVGKFGDALPPLPKLGEQGIGDQAFALHVLGSAAWEECLFRVLLFPLLYLLFKELLEFLGGGASEARGSRERIGQRMTRWSAELLAAVGSSLLFAGYHVQHRLEPPGDRWGALLGLRSSPIGS